MSMLRGLMLSDGINIFSHNEIDFDLHGFQALATLAWLFIRGICACAISSNLSFYQGHLRMCDKHQHISTNINYVDL